MYNKARNIFRDKYTTIYPFKLFVVLILTGTASLSLGYIFCGHCLLPAKQPILKRIRDRPFSQPNFEIQLREIFTLNRDNGCTIDD